MSAQELPEVGGAPTSQTEGPTADQTVDQPGQGWPDEKVREMQSKYDRQVSQERRRAQQAEDEAVRLRAQLNAAENAREQLTGFAREYDPEMVDTMLLKARIAELEAANSAQQAVAEEQRRQAEIELQNLRYHTEMAQALGVDPNDARYLQALESGDNIAIERVRAQLVMEKQAPPKEPAQEETVANQHDNVVLPGKSGPPPDQQDALAREYAERINKIQGNIPAIMALREEMRRKGYDPNPNPLME